MSAPPLQHCSVFYSSGYTVIYRHTYLNSFPKKRHDTRYDTRCYFNVQSKADIIQLNLPHGTKMENRKTKKIKNEYTQEYR